MKETLHTLLSYAVEIAKITCQMLLPVIIIAGALSISLKACHNTSTYQAVTDVIVIEAIQH